MSKMKISFSLLFTILLVGILATSTFARGAYWAGLSPDGTGGFTFNFVNTSETDKDFTVNVYEQDNNKEYTKLDYTSPAVTAVSLPEPPPSNTPYTYVYIKGSDVTAPDTTDYAFEVGKIYKFVLNDGTKDVAVQFGVLTDEKNLNMASIASSPTGVSLDVDGSKLYNANHTGTSGAAKKPNQNTHGFYQNNTNSCAGCHQTHTAADGEYLLFKDGIYSTCSACHDGTTGAYNSFAPATEDTPNEIAGTFNVDTSTAGKTSHNGSLHQADGSLNVSAAPGGNHNEGANNIAKATYGSEFDCASCHSPHGNGSASENNLNLDPLGWGGVAYGTTNDDTKNGKLFKGVEIASSVPTTSAGHTPFILVKKTVSTADVSSDKTKEGYLYYRAGVTAGDVALQTYRWNGQKYVADYSLFLRDIGHVSAPFANANTAFYKTSGSDLVDMSKEINVVWRDGFAFGSSEAMANVTKADISLGIDVETTNNIASLFDSKNANYVYDSGTEMSKYCASCHIDYLSTTRGNDTGVYTQAHRHATAQDRLSCVRCHFGHGTDATIMKDSNDQSQFTSLDHEGDLAYYVDPNPSSALKRYTGMSVCYSCHGHGEQFLGNPNVNHEQKNDSVYGRHAVGAEAGDYLLNGDPGAARSDRTDVNNPDGNN